MTNHEAKAASELWHTQYEATYGADAALHKGKPHASIQWNGTDVCADVRCSCGYHEHIDEGFFYSYRCVGCGKLYHVGDNVVLIEHQPGMIDISYPKEDDLADETGRCPEQYWLPERESHMAHAFHKFLQNLSVEDFATVKPILDTIVNAHLKGGK